MNNSLKQIYIVYCQKIMYLCGFVCSMNMCGYTGVSASTHVGRCIRRPEVNREVILQLLGGC